MGKKLAIKGHSTRGKEVIELLKMLGGENKFDRDGQAIMYSYYVSGNTILNDRLSIIEDDDFVIFNLEEFLEKYPFKVGDKVVYTKFGDNCDGYPVTIESMKWTGTTIEYTFNDCVTCLAKDLKMWNEEHDMDEDDSIFDCTDEMIEGVVEEKTKFGTASNPIKPKSNANCLIQDRLDEINQESDLIDKYEEFTDRAFKGAYEKCKSDIELNGFQLPDGYIFKDENGNVINTTKIVLEKKKREYPKTYKECHEIMVQWKEYDCNPNSELILCDVPIHDFCKLIVARNIYWKIAGEEMGLGKPWEPDWAKDTEKYVIYPYHYLYSIDVEKCRNTILAFPTREMRDAFYENFKELIEQCKELL